MTDPVFALDDLEGAVDRRAIASWLSDRSIEAVHLGLFDASGVLREKVLSPPAAVRAFEDGWSFIDAIQWWGPDDRLRPGASPGAGSRPATVDLASGRPYPFGPAAALFLADFSEPLRRLSPRHQVARMVERAAGVGLEAKVGWEFECIVLQEGMDPAMGDNRCWSATTMATEAEAVGGLAAALEGGGVPVDHVCAELGPGCLELALGPEPARRSADSAALAKLYTKAYFSRRGQRATFMAQLGPGFPGLGGHPSLSLHSTIDGAPVLADQPGVLSKVGQAAVAGIVELLPELLAMVAPTPNSFRRFGPGNWAPATATWGMGTYRSAVRVVADNPGTARLELRTAGADVSPHQGLAMLLGAAIWGVEQRLDPPLPMPPDEGRGLGGDRALPRDLTDAAERLAASPVARELFGPDFVEHVAASALAEVTACHRFVSDQERQRYLAQV